MSRQVDRRFAFDILFAILWLIFFSIDGVKMGKRVFAGRRFEFFKFLFLDFFLEYMNLMLEFLDFFLVISDIFCSFCLHFINDCIGDIEVFLTFCVCNSQILLNLFHLFYEIFLIIQSFLQNFILLFLSL
jgi:hypothetical protein